MINYELFKEITAERFLDYMPEDFKNCRVSISPVQKVNRTMDGLHLVSPDNEPWRISPTIYINDMYEKYQQSEDLKQVLEHAASEMAETFHSLSGKEALLDIDLAENNIIMALVNTEQNKKMLADIPHRKFQDLSVIYRMVVESDRDSISSAIVNHVLAEKLGMEETALYDMAVINTKRLFPPSIKSMSEVLYEILMKEGMPMELADSMIGEMPQERAMYIITNERGINGAVSMLYEEGLHRLSERLDSDLYILPSSIHEVIAISAETVDPNELAEMVMEINMGQVAIDERLSNQVYHYDKDLRKLALATDTPNKKLDGIAAEADLIHELKTSR